MSDVLRPYKDLFPQIGNRVMIDTSSVVIGDARLADDVGISADWLPFVATLTMYKLVPVQTSRTAAFSMSRINPRLIRRVIH